jgi:hypothetical protein
MARLLTAPLAVALLLVPRGRALAAEMNEYEIKAEFLERFTRFIDWPDDSFAGGSVPFVLCLAGENPFGDALVRMASARTIKERKIALRPVGKPSELDGCHLVFIARNEKSRLAGFLSWTNGKPVLTIGDDAGFAQAGAHIGLYLERGFVRFEINTGAVKRSGLKFSSRLLKLGRPVAEEGGL